MLTTKETNNIIERNYDLLLSIFNNLCGKYNIGDDRDDFLSECHLAIVTATPNFNEEQGDLASYWYICCKNTIVNYLRRGNWLNSIYGSTSYDPIVDNDVSFADYFSNMHSVPYEEELDKYEDYFITEEEKAIFDMIRKGCSTTDLAEKFSSRCNVYRVIDNVVNRINSEKHKHE